MFSKRIDTIQPFMVMEILAKAIEMEQRGIDVVHMEIGEPDFDTPKSIINGCVEEIKKGKTHYTHSLGILELRQALSDYKFRTRNTHFNPQNNIMITCGTSPAFFMLLSALLNPGDEVIISNPGYPCYQNFISFFGGSPVGVPIYENEEFNFNIKSLKEKISPKTKVLILNSPSNPTGQIIPHETLEQIANLIEKYNFWVISDEIYAELTYDGKMAPSLSEKQFERIHHKLIVLDGFSKYWAMTGWRLGYIITPSNLMEKIIPIQQNYFICAPSISQMAALYALNCEEETSEMLRIYKKRRDYIVREIRNIKGISCLIPKGAFYVFVNIKSLNIASLEFSMKLLENAHVATCPGIAFGSNGEGFVRFSYPTRIENITKAIKRISSFVNQSF
ncbi:MAG: aminotransferase class I/II-fold pyridoxal phosphate-dependent enzyme [Candidatus Lokiarchaeota archaeon]|nr:aminotransferase class I/II-fold pyridoxal phosphate-dependent enzyme [Candidatus Lokiarchaeota archaeon]MBD3338348.1 aminotransferase class I/II-fold pyridoxal phosphate-dependent enzyme [Candidatus Lokiarchaeota archaeon]